MTTGTGFVHVTSGVTDAAAASLGGDVTMGTIAGGTVPLTVVEAQGGQIRFASGYAIQFDSAISTNAQLGINPLASTSSGSGSAGQGLFVIGQAGQSATGASNSGGAGGFAQLLSGKGGSSASANGGNAAPAYVVGNTGGAITGGSGTGGKGGDWVVDSGAGGSSPYVVSVSSISSATPNVVTTTAPHGLTTGQVVLGSGIVASGVVGVNPNVFNTYWTITVTGASTFSLNSSEQLGSGSGGTFTANVGAQGLGHIRLGGITQALFCPSGIQLFTGDTQDFGSGGTGISGQGQPPYNCLSIGPVPSVGSVPAGYPPNNSNVIYVNPNSSMVVTTAGFSFASQTPGSSYPNVTNVPTTGGYGPFALNILTGNPATSGTAGPGMPWILHSQNGQDGTSGVSGAQGGYADYSGGKGGQSDTGTGGNGDTSNLIGGAGGKTTAGTGNAGNGADAGVYGGAGGVSSGGVGGNSGSVQIFSGAPGTGASGTPTNGVVNIGTGGRLVNTYFHMFDGGVGPGTGTMGIQLFNGDTSDLGGATAAGILSLGAVGVVAPTALPSTSIGLFNATGQVLGVNGLGVQFAAMATSVTYNVATLGTIPGAGAAGISTLYGGQGGQPSSAAAGGIGGSVGIGGATGGSGSTAGGNGGDGILYGGAAGTGGMGVSGQVRLRVSGSVGTDLMVIGQQGYGGQSVTPTIATTGNTTLSAAQYAFPVIRLGTITLTGNVTVTFPNTNGQWWVDTSGVNLNGHVLTFVSGSTMSAAVTPSTTAPYFVQTFGSNTMLIK